PPANPCCTCPSTGPANSSGKAYGTTSSATRPTSHEPPDPTHQSLSAPPPQARPKEPKGKAGTGQQITHAHRVQARPRRTQSHQSQRGITVHGSRLRVDGHQYLGPNRRPYTTEHSPPDRRRCV